MSEITVSVHMIDNGPTHNYTVSQESHGAGWAADAITFAAHQAERAHVEKVTVVDACGVLTLTHSPI